MVELLVGIQVFSQDSVQEALAVELSTASNASVKVDFLVAFQWLKDNGSSCWDLELDLILLGPI